MNGLSLLLLLSSLGATTSIETGLNGQPVYTIRIEPQLINELNKGQTIPILVAPKDRGLRRFKIAIASDANLRSGATARATDFNSRAGELFDYEPTQLPDGEIEYVVQISPERLASLEAGRAIEGDIAADIPEVHRFLIFVGIGQLPSQQEAAAQQQAVAPASNANPPSLLRSAGAEVRAPAPTTQPRTTTPLTKSAFPSNTTTTQQAGPQRGLGTPDPLTQFNTRTTDSRNNWRNQPDQSTINPPPFANAPTSSGGTFQRSPGVATVTDRNGYATQPNYNNQYPPSNYAENPAYAQPNATTYPQQGYPSNPPMNYQQPPAATIAARNDLPQVNANSTMPPATGWSQPTASQPVSQPGVAVTPAVTAPATLAATSSKLESEKERPWTPLILTTLALFASLGANAYLGWLAWSFFWRFRDAVTESARTRAQISSSRQAA